MANPKNRHTHARGAKRRTHWRLNPANTGNCPQCHQPKLPHRVCPNCGYYAGREVIAPPEALTASGNK